MIDMKNKEKATVLYSVDSALGIKNNTENADEFAALMSLMLHDCVKMLESYMNDTGDKLTYQEIKEEIIKVSDMYSMAEAGMSEEDIKEVVDLNYDFKLIKSDD